MSLSSDPNQLIVRALELRWNEIELKKDEYEIDQHQICPTIEHKCIYDQMTIHQFMQIGTGESLNKVESLSFIFEENNLIDSIHLEKIIEMIPLIECISLNNQKFTSNANKLFIEKIAPKILHLSLDDSTTELSQLFKNLIQLTDLKLTIKNPEFDASCLRELSDTLINLYLRDVSTQLTVDSNSGSDSGSDSDFHTSYTLKNAMENLRKGGAKNVQFLRIESDEHQDSVVTAYQQISKLSQLRGLNLSTRNYPGPFNAYEYELTQIGKLNKLETLTLKLHTTDIEHEHLIRILSESAQFKSTLFRFRLLNAEFNLKCVEYIVNNFKLLESLQLVDCLFLRKDMNKILEMFTKFNRLNQLIIENNNLFDTENSLSVCSDCDYIGVEQIIYLIDNCKHLDDLHFAHPINDRVLDNLQSFVREKQINFTF